MDIPPAVEKSVCGQDGEFLMMKYSPTWEHWAEFKIKGGFEGLTRRALLGLTPSFSVARRK